MVNIILATLEFEDCILYEDGKQVLLGNVVTSRYIKASHKKWDFMHCRTVTYVACKVMWG
jgi:hypothetical protein